MCGLCLFIVFVEAFVNVLAGVLTLAIFVRVILSWIPDVRLPLGIGDFAWQVSEPILGPIRRLLPAMGGIDFSPFVGLILIQLAASVLLRLLPPPV